MVENQRGPERIWLEPTCFPEQSWCNQKLDNCEECDRPPVEYVRLDLVQTLKDTQP